MSNVGGQDFDYAFSYSMGGATGILTPDDAAVDWMVTVNFREGNEMKNEGEAQEFQYQPRGYAKYAGALASLWFNLTSLLLHLFIILLFHIRSLYTLWM